MTLPSLPLDQIVKMARFAEDPSNWVVSPPMSYPSMLYHCGVDIGYAVRCQARKEGYAKPTGPLPIRHLFIDYTEIEEEDEIGIGLFIDSTVKMFKMDDLSVIKSEERGLHVFQKLFLELPFEN